VRALAADVGGADGPADRGTIDAYLKTLARLMIVEYVTTNVEIRYA
jgi:hypothetical protein